MVIKRKAKAIKQKLTINGFTPEFEAKVLAAVKDKRGSIKFDNAEDAVKYLRRMIEKPHTATPSRSTSKGRAK